MGSGPSNHVIPSHVNHPGHAVNHPGHPKNHFDVRRLQPNPLRNSLTNLNSIG